MNEKVSIIVPVYNTENYLESCIDSLIQQTYKNIEIILINDGSTDSSGEIIHKYAQKDNRINYLFQENLGPSAARNKGIDLSSGNYVLFVDSDDWIDKDMINRMIKEFEDNIIDIVLCDYFLESDKPLYQKIIEETNENIEITEYIKYLLVSTDRLNSQCNRIYKKSIIQDNQLYFKECLKVGEDQIFNIEYFKYVKKISYISKGYYHYRVIKNSTCRKIHFNQDEMLINQQTIRNTVFAEWENNSFDYKLGSAKWFLQTTAAYCFLSIDSLSFQEAKLMIKSLIGNEVCLECLDEVKKSKVKFDSNIHRVFIPLINTQKISLIICGFYSFKSVFLIKNFILKRTYKLTSRRMYE